MSQVKGSKSTRTSIDVLGLYGSFEVPKQDITVRYVSTFAGNREPESGHASLLSELKPMRERIDADDLRDLGALLQRDLNDSRVAKELVPYLLGQNREISFFPAILAVLMPQGYLHHKDTNYPSKSKEGQIEKYGEYWSFEHFALADDEPSPFGKLSIYSVKTTVLVLDGQHRASAFRYVAGDVDEIQKDVYAAFYEPIHVDRFDADLPVTIIWFDGQTDIDPGLVSRRLFVDVNNTAREVSRSRNILLDDREAPALITRFMFSRLAKANPFAADSLSLLHGAFDVESDLMKKGVGHSMSLTNPEYMYDVISWMFLGSTTYDSTDKYNVKRNDARSRTYRDILGQTFDGDINDRDFKQIHEEDDPIIILDDVNKIREFETEFEVKIGPLFEDIFNRFGLLKPHFEAASETRHYCLNDAPKSTESVWKRVFAGGEGLYYTFMYGGRDSSKIKAYQKEIGAIERRFKRIRSEKAGVDEPKANKAYNSIRTKAFQIGLFMALRVFKQQLEYTQYLEAHEHFISELNKLSIEQWIAILTDLKPELLNDADPKKWPAYQKLFLRITLSDSDAPFYDYHTLKYSPEGVIIRERLKDKIKAWSETNGFIWSQLSIDEIDSQELEGWIVDITDDTRKLFLSCGLTPIEGNYMAMGRSEVENQLSS